MLAESVTTLEEQTNTLVASLKTLNTEFAKSKDRSISGSIGISKTISLPQSVFVN